MKGHKEWRGHSYALYLRGAPGKLEPLPTYKNAPRQKRVHSYSCGWDVVSGFPCLFIRTIPKEVFQASSVKCEKKLMHLWFWISPQNRLQMNIFFFNLPNFFGKNYYLMPFLWKDGFYSCLAMLCCPKTTKSIQEKLIVGLIPSADNACCSKSFPSYAVIRSNYSSDSSPNLWIINGTDKSRIAATSLTME